MIRVPLTDIVYFYLFVFLGFVVVAWLLHERRRSRDARRSLQFRLRCAICGLEFEDRTASPLPTCPHCGRPNERVRLDPL